MCVYMFNRKFRYMLKTTLPKVCFFLVISALLKPFLSLPPLHEYKFNSSQIRHIYLI